MVVVIFCYEENLSITWKVGAVNLPPWVEGQEWARETVFIMTKASPAETLLMWTPDEGLSPAPLCPLCWEGLTGSQRAPVDSFLSQVCQPY